MLYLSTVGYELFRAATDQYLPTKQKMFEVEVKHTVDKDGNNTQSNYTVKFRPKNSLKFVLNLYHTKCSILVNGKGKDKFLNEDVPRICQAISDANIDIPRLTKVIQESLLAPCSVPGTPKPKLKVGSKLSLPENSNAQIPSLHSNDTVLTVDPVVGDLARSLDTILLDDASNSKKTPPRPIQSSNGITAPHQFIDDRSPEGPSVDGTTPTVTFPDSPHSDSGNPEGNNGQVSAFELNKDEDRSKTDSDVQDSQALPQMSPDRISELIRKHRPSSNEHGLNGSHSNQGTSPPNPIPKDNKCAVCRTALSKRPPVCDLCCLHVHPKCLSKECDGSSVQICVTCAFENLEGTDASFPESHSQYTEQSTQSLAKELKSLQAKIKQKDAEIEIRGSQFIFQKKRVTKLEAENRTLRESNKIAEETIRTLQATSSGQATQTSQSAQYSQPTGPCMTTGTTKACGCSPTPTIVNYCSPYAPWQPSMPHPFGPWGPP